MKIPHPCCSAHVWQSEPVGGEQWVELTLEGKIKISLDSGHQKQKQGGE